MTETVTFALSKPAARRVSSSLAVARKDVAALWLSPVPYFVGGLFNAALGLLFVDQLVGRQQALVQPLFPLAGFLLLATVPVVTMRSLAEERRTGTLDLLVAIPVRFGGLVVGKWAATWLTTMVVAVAPALAFPALVAFYGEPDRGPVIAGFVGLALLAALLCGLGVAASALTAAQPVAAITAFVVGAVAWFAEAGARTISTGGLARSFSLSERMRAFAGGAIDSADAGFLLGLTVGLLALARAVAARRSVAALVPLVIGLAAAAGIVVATDRTRLAMDLTAEQSLTLTDVTRGVVAAVKEDTKVTVILAADDPGRAPAVALLDRYRRLNRRIASRVLDPNAAPGELARLGIDPGLGGVAVEQGGDVVIVPTITEQDLTSALARVTRGRTATLCATTGHGEAAVDDDGPMGLLEAGALLRGNGYEMVTVDLLTQSRVPDACDGVIVASPTAALTDVALGALRDYLEADGRVLILADPSSVVTFESLLSPFGLGLHRGVVLEGDPSGALPDDPTAPIVRRYSSASPVVRRLAPTFFPGVQEVTVDDDSAPVSPSGLTISRLADTSPLSYLETEPLGGQFDPVVDVAGPITVAAAADRSRLDTTTNAVHRSRLVVVGDVDFATNAHLGAGGNSRLLVQAADWLTLDEELVVLSTNLPSPRPLTMTRGRLAYARFISLAVLPGLFGLGGAAVWLLRRRR